jgi:hypothetical protein
MAPSPQMTAAATTVENLQGSLQRYGNDSLKKAMEQIRSTPKASNVFYKERRAAKE